MQNLNLLIKELISLPTETEWLEFKHNNFDPAMIGADISALANSAAYLVSASRLRSDTQSSRDRRLSPYAVLSFRRDFMLALSDCRLLEYFSK